MSELSGLVPYISPVALLISGLAAWFLMKGRQEFAAKSSTDKHAQQLSEMEVRLVKAEAAIKDTDDQATRLAALEMRVVRAETVLATVPTTGEITALSLAIAGLRGDIKGFEATIAGFKELFERQEMRVDRHEEILSEAARRQLEDRRG